VAQEPVPGAGQGGEAVPPDALVTPDWVDDEEWERICASRTAEDELDGTEEDWDTWDPRGPGHRGHLDHAGTSTVPWPAS
jgi:hypothetical protein